MLLVLGDRMSQETESEDFSNLVVELVGAALAMPGTGEGRCSAGSLGPHSFIFFSFFSSGIFFTFPYVLRKLHGGL
jgi:hypothetical protein